jgi:hypothetical protein
MIISARRGWIEAAKAFAVDPYAEVVCPVCKKGKLRSEDISLPSGEIAERRIYCDMCESDNFIRLGPQDRAPTSAP